MDEPKRTYVNADEAVMAKARPGFVPIHCYARMRPEDGEIGSIRAHVGTSTLDPESGLWVTTGVCVERIFLKE